MAWFPLPPTGGEHPPAFRDEAQCRTWLATQPLANYLQTQQELLQQIDKLNRFSLEHDERLRILELLREAVYATQTECGKRFARRPLPFSAPEMDAFMASRTLWQALVTGYLHCLHACLENDPAVIHEAAMISERAMSCVRAELLDNYNGSIEPENAFWRRMHAILAAAERLGVASAMVKDKAVREMSTVSTAQLYSQNILLDMADPYALTLKQLELVRRWMARWRDKIVLKDSKPSGDGIVSVEVDLSGGMATHFGASQPGIGRWIDITYLDRSVRKRIHHLRKGESPATLKLGDDMSPLAAEMLLSHLTKRWSDGVADHLPNASGSLFVVGTFLGIHRQLGAGGPPRDASAYALREHVEIATFGHTTQHRRPHPATAEEARAESWQVIGEKPQEMSIVNEGTESRVRLAAGQLIAVRLRDTKHFLIGSVREIRMRADGSLVARFRLLPGEPQPAWLQSTAMPGKGGDCVPAILLPAVEAIGSPASVVVPLRCYQENVQIELSTDATRRARFDSLIDRGYDFDRARYTVL